MKTLLIIRHAKSSWDDASISDVDRPLNDRGKRDAPAMAKRLIKAGIDIDRFVSSPAKRARQTAELFVREYGGKEKKIRFVPDLYHAAQPVFEAVVDGLDDGDDTVAVFSHNPGITAFVNTLTTAVKLDNMPTCGVFVTKSDCKHWKDFRSSGPQFGFFDHPKAEGRD
ncbi:SixA phosphatase family protein [Puia sp.]|jgi:phosphohistidine phosphatase|uniref:SixA phosphatase family protein n=1 Tax=Puia sp. TaxID=2045100 RepID=UPI002F40C27D